MKFDKSWTKENDVKLKSFHECDWKDKCTMCQNFDECEEESKEDEQQ